MRLLRDLSVSTATAGFVAVLVGFTSTVAVVFAAAQAFEATPAQTTSWVWAIAVGCGSLSVALSLWRRVPVMIAWSTPGAAVLASAASGAGFTMGEAAGAFVVCSIAIALVGFSGLFERLMQVVPLGLAAALLAGALTRFALDGFVSAQAEPLLVVGMLAAYLAGRRVAPRYAMVGVLVSGVLLAVMGGDLHAEDLRWSLARPVWLAPTFSLSAVVSLAVPLFVVTMAGQNLPGVAAIRTAGYEVPLSKVIGATGAAGVLLAPFGGYALNLAAITAAICLGPEAHEDPDRRYSAAVVNGVLYMALGIFAGAVTGLLAAFPAALVRALAALALVGTITANLAAALADERSREPAILCFLVTLSGVTLAQIGSAFWGAVAGVVALAVGRGLPVRRPTG
ncbi:MAG: benzoate/H(+) symporter BenE family transporter [Acidimicrobiia bacterium]|nr:benzoate/H(+) symporter BenE family transporter [Acidimicrobiia bacterium]